MRDNRHTTDSGGCSVGPDGIRSRADRGKFFPIDRVLPGWGRSYVLRYRWRDRGGLRYFAGNPSRWGRVVIDHVVSLIVVPHQRLDLVAEPDRGAADQFVRPRYADQETDDD